MLGCVCVCKCVWKQQRHILCPNQNGKSSHGSLNKSLPHEKLAFNQFNSILVFVCNFYLLPLACVCFAIFVWVVYGFTYRRRRIDQWIAWRFVRISTLWTIFLYGFGYIESYLWLLVHIAIIESLLWLRIIIAIQWIIVKQMRYIGAGDCCKRRNQKKSLLIHTKERNKTQQNEKKLNRWSECYKKQSFKFHFEKSN